jgi:hypothetical protein
MAFAEGTCLFFAEVYTWNFVSLYMFFVAFTDNGFPANIGWPAVVPGEYKPFVMLIK